MDRFFFGGGGKVFIPKHETLMADVAVATANGYLDNLRRIQNDLHTRLNLSRLIAGLKQRENI